MPGAETAANPPHSQTGGPPKRRLRNFLLDRPFQLKYTGMVVAVTTVLSLVVGFFEYRASKETSDVILAQSLADPMYSEPSLRRALEADFRASDRKVILRLAGMLAVLIVALGLTGIVITHKVVGPVYKMKFLFREVTKGKLKLAGKLRRGDELQTFFEVYAQMIESLRERQSSEIARIDTVIREGEGTGVPEDTLKALRQLRDDMQAALD